MCRSGGNQERIRLGKLGKQDDQEVTGLERRIMDQEANGLGCQGTMNVQVNRTLGDWEAKGLGTQATRKLGDYEYRQTGSQVTGKLGDYECREVGSYGTGKLMDQEAKKLKLKVWEARGLRSIVQLLLCTPQSIPLLKCPTPLEPCLNKASSHWSPSPVRPHPTVKGVSMVIICTPFDTRPCVSIQVSF